MAGKDEQAAEAAKEATELADRLHYPVGRAAALQAEGFATGTGSSSPQRARPGSRSADPSTPPAAPCWPAASNSRPTPTRQHPRWRK